MRNASISLLALAMFISGTARAGQMTFGLKLIPARCGAFLQQQAMGAERYERANQLFGKDEMAAAVRNHGPLTAAAIATYALDYKKPGATKLGKEEFGFFANLTELEAKRKAAGIADKHLDAVGGVLACLAAGRWSEPGVAETIIAREQTPESLAKKIIRCSKCSNQCATPSRCGAAAWTSAR